MTPRRKFLKLLALLAFVGIVLSGGFIWLVGSRLSAPANRPVQIPTDLGAEEIRIAGECEIAGSFIEGEEGKGAVLLLHGIRGDRSAFVEHARFLRGAGFSVLMIDLRGHGESARTNITFGKFESRDVQAAVAYLKRRLPAEKVGVIGSSLGGAAAVFSEPPLEVDALVLEMVYRDVRSAVANRVAIVLGDWARPFGALLTVQLKMRLEMSADELAPVEFIRKLHTPKLMVSGTEDQHTLREDTERLYEAAAEPKELWMIEGAKHEDLYRFAGKDYEKRITKYFSKHLRGSDLGSR